MLENILVDRDLQERITNAVWDAFFGRSVTAGYYRNFTDVSAGTATGDLKAATAAGLLTAVGATRARRYTAGPKLYEALVRELGLEERPTSPEMGRSLIVTELSRRLMPREARQAPLFASD